MKFFLTIVIACSLMTVASAQRQTNRRAETLVDANKPAVYVSFLRAAEIEPLETGEVLTDFLQLSRAALGESGDGAKNVAAVLAAALFEDTLRRIATQNGIPHIERLQDLLTELKEKQILQGTQVGIAISYLNFRNSALHAQWDRVERESVVSVLGFVEQLLMKHFS